MMMTRFEGCLILDWMFGATEQRKVIKTASNIYWLGEIFTLIVKNCFWRFRFFLF